MFYPIDPTKLGSEALYEYEQLLRRVRSYITVKAIVNGAVCLLYLVSFPPPLRLTMTLIALLDGLLLGPYWLLVRHYPILATVISLAFTAMAISAGDWVGGYQTGASGILYAMLVMAASLILIQPWSTYFVAAVISVIYVSIIFLEVLGIIPITFPHTISNLTRVVTLNVICIYGLAAMSNVVTRLYREMLYNRTHAEEIAEQRTVELRESHAELERTFEVLQASNRRLATLQRITATLQSTLPLEKVLRTVVQGAVEGLNYIGSSILMPDQWNEKLVVKAVWGGKFLEVLSKTLKVPRETFSLPLSAEENPVVKAYLREKAQTTHGVPEPLFIGLFPFPRAKAAWAIKQATGVKTSISIPLRAGQTVVGVLLAFSPRPHISEDERATLLALADQAGLAIDNARLFAETMSERAKLSAVITGTEDAIMVTDEKDHILLLNPAARRAFKIVEESWVGQPLAEVVENQALHDLFTRLSVQSTAQSAEIPVDRRTFYANLAPIPGVGKVLAMQDITYLKELDEMKSDFVATVSHDLRSPLSIIEGYMDLLKDVGPLNAQQSQFVKRIKEATANMTHLITDLLDLGKIEAGLEMGMMPCDLEETIDLVVTSLQGWAERKGIELRVELSENVPKVQGNSTRLRQVLANLVENALKYTPSGGTVTIQVVAENGSTTVCVKDTGIGISPDHLPHVFEKFYRVETKETNDVTGTGLGLAIARSIIEVHGGRIWAESQPGAGSTFSFTLPQEGRLPASAV
jgi:signal transduction histidine kinase